VKKNGINIHKKPKIILLLQFYDPEPVYKGQKFAEAIASYGYNVEVVTGFPNYPGGKIYTGFKLKMFQRTLENGITVTRLPLYPSHDESRFGRILNYVSFFISSLIYLTFFASRANLVYAYHPPVTVGLAATVANIFRRAPVVVDIHDLWPDTLPATNMLSNQRLLGLIGRACKWMYGRSAHIIVHSNGFKQKLIARDVEENKITTIIGWGQENNLQNSRFDNDDNLQKLKNSPGLKVLFAGNIGRAQGLDSVISAAQILQSKGLQNKVTFILLGSGVALDGLIRKTDLLNLTNIKFLPRVPQEEVKQYFDAADCLLVHLKDNPLFQITLPSKTQAYMIAGKPILMGVGGEAAELITRIKAGMIAAPENPESLAAVALELSNLSINEREIMGSAGQAYYWKELSMDKGISKFDSIFSMIKRL